MNQKISLLFASVFLAVLGWIWTQTYSKLSSVEKELVEIKLEMVKIQATIIDREEVVRIVKEQIGK